MGAGGAAQGRVIPPSGGCGTSGQGVGVVRTPVNKVRYGGLDRQPLEHSVPQDRHLQAVEPSASYAGGTGGGSGPKPSGEGESTHALSAGEGWEVVIHLGEQAGQSIVREMRIYGSADKEQSGEQAPKGGLTTSVLRSLPLARLAEQARQERAYRLAAMEDYYSDEQGGLTDEERAESLRRPGPRGRTPGFYAVLAQRYLAVVRAGHRGPVKLLAEEYGVPVRTMETRIGEARKRGILTKPSPGKPGGELTPEGLGFLEYEQEGQ